MSLSGKMYRPAMGVSPWDQKRIKDKYIKLLGTCSILIGVYFITFGISRVNSADALAQNIEAPVTVVDVSSQVDFADQKLAEIQFAQPHAESTQADQVEPNQTGSEELTLSSDAESVLSEEIGQMEFAAGPLPEEALSVQGKVDPIDPSIESISAEAAEETAALVGEAEISGGGRVPKDYFLKPNEIQWFDEPFLISHYTYALERDPLYANDRWVSVPGLPKEMKFREGFIFGGRGVIQQGTGKSESGHFITIDWQASSYDPTNPSLNQWVFKFGEGRPVTPWETVAVKHPSLPPGTRIVIENYGTLYHFVVGDTGLDLAVDQIDIFVGELTIGQADQLGLQRSRVGIVQPDYYRETSNGG